MTRQATSKRSLRSGAGVHFSNNGGGGEGGVRVPNHSAAVVGPSHTRQAGFDKFFFRFFLCKGGATDRSGVLT